MQNLSPKAKLIISAILAFVVVLIILTPKEKSREDYEETSLVRLTGEERKTEKEDEARGPRAMPTGYEGKVLAGREAPYIEFNQADYEKAVSDKKTILLVFCPDWGKICPRDEPEMFRGFNLLGKKHLIGFKVNYKDENIDDYEKSLAEQNRIFSENMKAIVQDGRQIYKSSEKWDAWKLLEVFGSL